MGPCSCERAILGVMTSLPDAQVISGSELAEEAGVEAAAGGEVVVAVFNVVDEGTLLEADGECIEADDPCIALSRIAPWIENGEEMGFGIADLR